MQSEESLAAEIAARIYGGRGARPDGVPVADLELDAAERELGARFPRSYRVYLLHFGGQTPPGRRLFGLPRDGLGTDMVLRNAVDLRPPHYLKFTTDGEGRSFYFDTARTGADGECPVVVRDADGREAEAAACFLDFLTAAPRAAMTGAGRGA